MKGHTLPGINQKSDSKLVDLTGGPTPHDNDGDKNMPIRRKGLGPRSSFGGVPNPELDPKREAEDTAE